MINTMTAYTSLYEYLELDASATEQEINKAFRSLAKQHHPDRQSGDPQLFVLINKAYDILKSEQYRKIYDQQGIYGLIEAYPRLARPPLNGAIAEVEYLLNLEELVSGGQIPLHRYNSKIKRDHTDRAPLSFPPGMEDGHQIHLEGTGYPGTDGGEDGLLIIKIKHQLPPAISLEAWKVTLSISVPQALLDAGGNIRTQLLDQHFEINITSNSSTQDRFPIPLGDQLPLPFTGAQVQLVSQKEFEQDSDSRGTQETDSAPSSSGTLPTPVERKSKLSPLTLILTVLIMLPGLIGILILSVFLYQLTQNPEQVQANTDQNQAQVIPGDSNTVSEHRTTDQNEGTETPGHTVKSIPDPSPMLPSKLSQDEQARLALQQLARKTYKTELNPKDYDTAQEMQDVIDRLKLHQETRQQFGIALNIEDFDNLAAMQQETEKIGLTHEIRNHFGMDLRYQDFNSPAELKDLLERLNLEKIIKEEYGHPVTHEDFFSAASMKDAIQRMKYQKLVGEKHGIKLRYQDYPSAQRMKEAIFEMGHQVE